MRVIGRNCVVLRRTGSEDAAHKGLALISWAERATRLADNKHAIDAATAHIADSAASRCRPGASARVIGDLRLREERDVIGRIVFTFSRDLSPFRPKAGFLGFRPKPPMLDPKCPEHW